MGVITVLVLYDEGSGDHFAIPVNNFPILPVGSDVSFVLESFGFESLTIKNYGASSYLGNWVQVEFDSDKPRPGEPTFEQLKSIMNKEQAFGCSYLYPGVITFG